MQNLVRSINLTQDDKAALESILRQGTAEARTYIRAKILLLKSEDHSNEYIADKFDVCISVVRLCIDKYNAGGIASALHDSKGRGRKAEITDSDVTWVINKACQKPKDFGYSAPASFTRFINSIAEQEGHPRMATVTETTLRKILANAKIRPFKASYYCERRDPDFDSKMHDVLVIYKQVSLQFDEDGNLKPFGGVPVHALSYDKEPGMQALDATAEDRPPVPGTDKNSTVCRDYEYARLGTLSLLAAIDLLTGEAIPLVSDTHKSSYFVHFLKKLDKKYPEGDKSALFLITIQRTHRRRHMDT